MKTFFKKNDAKKDNNFKGKVYVYRNNNGHEEEFEKEFDTPEEFNRFNQQYHQPELTGPFMGLGDWANLQNFFNDLIDQRFGLGYYDEPCECDECCDDETCESHQKEELPYGIDMNKYENEMKKIEYQKAHKSEEIQKIKKTLEQLEDYKKKFKSEGRDDMVKDLDNDIKKLQKKLDELEK